MRLKLDFKFRRCKQRKGSVVERRRRQPRQKLLVAFILQQRIFSQQLTQTMPFGSSLRERLKILLYCPYAKPKIERRKPYGCGCGRGIFA